MEQENDEAGRYPLYNTIQRYLSSHTEPKTSRQFDRWKLIFTVFKMDWNTGWFQSSLIAQGSETCVPENETCARGSMCVRTLTQGFTKTVKIREEWERGRNKEGLPCIVENALPANACVWDENH